MGLEVLLSITANIGVLASGYVAYRRSTAGLREEARLEQRLAAVRALIETNQLHRGNSDFVLTWKLAVQSRLALAGSQERVLAGAGAPETSADQGLLEALENRQIEVSRQLSELPDTSHIAALAALEPLLSSYEEPQIPTPRADLTDGDLEPLDDDDFELLEEPLLDLAQNPDAAPAINTIYTTLNEVFEKLGPPPEHLTTPKPTGRGDGGEPK
ncbi:hypothetical protein [Streptomyces racemochromogenes]|uniref:hypothetical protein n=1 Tax=Streptomyces racemochromogenes TaxID=67353 RepID=UPI0031EDF7C2